MRHVSMLRISLAVIASFYIVAIAAEFFAPYGFATGDREHTNCPPTRIHVVDESGHWHLRPFVYRYVELPGELESYQEVRSQRYPLEFFIQGAKYKFANILSGRRHLFGVASPASIFIFGTDEYGRDQLSRFIYGARISLIVGTLAAAVALFIGLGVGALCGTFGGWVDVVIMRFTELFMALPWLYLLLAVRAILPLRTSASVSLLILLSVVALVGWAKPARLFRGVILSAQELDFVVAASVIGGGKWYVFRRHVLPQTGSLLLTQAALLIPQFVIAEVTLSFLGLGVGEPIPSWGSILAPLARYESLALHWWLVLPVCAVVPLFFSYHEVTSILQRDDIPPMM